MKDHSLWELKYRPTNIDNYICSEELKSKYKDWMWDKNIPHILLSGRAGSGKTTLAKLIVNNPDLDCDYLYLNASDENGIDTIREKVKSFASSASFKSLKIIILDEADGLTREAQEALRHVIEEYSLNTRFIFTCNYLEKIIEPLQSRFSQGNFKLQSPSKGEIARLLANILDKEQIKYDLKDVARIINSFYPDIRSIIGKTQRYVNKDNTLVFDPINVLEEYNYKILEILKKPTNKAFYEIRQILADSQLDDFQPFYRFLFDNLEQFSKGLDADITIVIDEYSWRSKIVPDREINIMSCIAQILQTFKNNKLLKG